MTTPLAIGTVVRKVTGDYQVTGEIRAAFTNYEGGPLRYVVAIPALEGGVFTHNFNPEQLVAIDKPPGWKIGQPAYVLDNDDPDGTLYPYRDRDELCQDLEPGDVRELDTIYQGPKLYAARVVVVCDEDGDPTDTELQFFPTEREARAAGVVQPVTGGV